MGKYEEGKPCDCDLCLRRKLYFQREYSGTSPNGNLTGPEVDEEPSLSPDEFDRLARLQSDANHYNDEIYQSIINAEAELAKRKAQSVRANSGPRIASPNSAWQKKKP